jgi:flagellar motor switch protein FliM
MGEAAGILRRIMRAAPGGSAEAAPLTPARALRLAFARAADRAAGLAVAVLGVADEVAPLDDLLTRLEPGLMLLSVERAGTVGLVALDAEARAAAVEAQTLGRPSAQAADPREPTAVDAALALPLAQAFLEEAEAATAGTRLDGWVGAARAGGRLPSAREAALTLPDGDYRAVRLTLDLGAGGRQGLCLLLLPVALRQPEAPGAAGDGWREGLGEQVMAAPAEVTAVLHRLRLPLAEAEGLDVGRVLPLPGVTVASVRLQGPGGADLGPARLGQVAGMRAVRLEAPPPPTLVEIGPAGPVPLGLPGGR